jgi:multiple sugar transport system permease protein
MNRTRKLVARTGFSAALALVLVWSLAPSGWRFLTALESGAEITRVRSVHFPETPTLVHVRSPFLRKPFASYLVNSARISGAATLLCLMVFVPAAGSIARLRPGSRLKPRPALTWSTGPDSTTSAAKHHTGSGARRPSS